MASGSEVPFWIDLALCAPARLARPHDGRGVMPGPPGADHPGLSSHHPEVSRQDTLLSGFGS
jgi:hypothetical protein